MGTDGKPSNDPAFSVTLCLRGSKSSPLMLNYAGNHRYSMKYTITPVTETYIHRGHVQRANGAVAGRIVPSIHGLK